MLLCKNQRSCFAQQPVDIIKIYIAGFNEEMVKKKIVALTTILDAIIIMHVENRRERILNER